MSDTTTIVQSDRSVIDGAVSLERSNITLLLRSDHTARAYDVFETDRSLGTKKSLTLIARPLPPQMIRDTCIVRRSNMPVFTYLINEPVWSLAPGTSVSTLALGELVSVIGKKETTWKGILVYSDNERIVLYHPTLQQASLIDIRHVQSVTIERVPKNEAVHYAKSNVCVLDIRDRPSNVLVPKIELAYDFNRGALTFAVIHIASFDGVKNLLSLQSFVEIRNDTGIHLLNAIVRVRQRRHDREEGIAYGGQQSQESARGGEEVVAMAAPPTEHRKSSVHPRFARSRSIESTEIVALSASEAVLDVELNTEKTLLHLAPSSQLRVSAFSATSVPAQMRYTMKEMFGNRAQSGNPTLDWNHYTDAERVINFRREDLLAHGNHKQFLSGTITVQDSLDADEPLSEKPAHLDAWENMSSGRMHLKLGTNGGVRWRAYNEDTDIDNKKSLKLQYTRLDIMVIPSSAPGKIRFKFAMTVDQPAATPEFVSAFRRLPVPLGADEEDESVLLLRRAFQITQIPLADQKHWKREGEFGRRALRIIDHDEEDDESHANHMIKDFVHELETTAADVEVYQKHRFPLLVSYIFFVQYTLGNM